MHYMTDDSISESAPAVSLPAFIADVRDRVSNAVIALDMYPARRH